MPQTTENVNPYRSPQSTAKYAPRNFALRTSRVAAPFTRIVVFPIGINVLGMLELCAVFGIGVYTAALPGIFALMGMTSIMAFDLWWRSGQTDEEWWVRFVSPYAGGCLAFLPVWVLFPIGAMILVTSNH